MPPKQPQGQQAVANGLHFEADVAAKLLQSGYEQWPTRPTLITTNAYFVRQCRGLVRNVYGGSMCLDFYLYHPTKQPHGLIIEAKYQERGGSTDEKLYFTVMSLLASGIPSMLVLLGKGFKRPAREWCLRQQRPEQLQVITDWIDFLRLVNRGLL